MAEKPASRPIAKALPKGDGFLGQFALPGIVPMLVGRPRPEVFPTAEAAETAALKALFGVLTSRTIDTRKAGGYRRMTGAELAVALDAADITPTYFAEIYGVPQARLIKWLDGEQDVPHSAAVLVQLLTIPEAFEMARELTSKAQEGGADE